MKYFKLTLSLLTVIAVVSLSSCKDNDELKGFNRYDGFECEDTECIHPLEVTPEEQTITREITINEENKKYIKTFDFQLVNICFNDYNYGYGPWDWMPAKCDISGLSFTAEWISGYFTIEGDKCWLTLKFKKNTSKDPRAVRITIWQEDNNIIYGGAFCFEQKGLQEPEEVPMAIRYKKQIYRAIASIDENGKVSYDNKEFADVMNLLNSRNDIETVVFDDEIVDYFDSEDMKENPDLRNLQKRIKLSEPVGLRTDLPAVTSRADDPLRYMTSNAFGYMAMFDDTDFTDTYVCHNITSAFDYCNIKNMSSCGLNDKVSSLAVAYRGDDPAITMVLTIWEDGDFNYGDNNRTKHRISFIASKSFPTVSRNNLKNIRCLYSQNSWNDRISSASLYAGVAGRFFQDY